MLNETVQCPPYPEAEIRRRIDGLPKLASLRSISSALSDLLNSEHSFTAQIAEIIRRDPSLTSRLLKLVNSVFFGVSRKITNIEEAVFYLGLRQIRQLAIATPVIEDFEGMKDKSVNIDWAQLWQQSIGAALMTREILHHAGILYDDDTDYLIGLLCKVGKIVEASLFPNEFQIIHSKVFSSFEAIQQAEARLIGWDHAQIGAYYLERNQLNAEIVDSVRFQYDPESAESFRQSSAAIQLAIRLLSSKGIRGIEKIEEENVEWTSLKGWSTLFDQNAQDGALAVASLNRTLQRLPLTLNGVV